MKQHHFLLVTFPAQGHINPARQLARRLARTAGTHVTISIGLSAHRRMFPSSTTEQEVPKDEEGLISYAPYSDGNDDELNSSNDDRTNFLSRFKLVGTESLSLLARNLASRGRPVTCIIYTILLSWAAEVAHDLGVPSVPFWVQSATVFAIFHRYFHGTADLISAHKNDPSFSLEFPGLPSVQIRDLPFFLNSTNALHSSILSGFEEMFRIFDREVAASKFNSKPRVLVNTFDSLEPEAISAVDELELMAIAPTVDDTIGGDLYGDDPSGYMEWLDAKKDKSVVYVSFGSIAVLKKRQLEEILQGLEESGRPYLWIVRKDNKEKEGEIELEAGKGGMLVEWCSQVRVLSHRSIGCFVTHCGWNSTLESLFCGVPTVMLPQWADQMTNARLAESVWGTGVWGEENKEGVVEGRELRRCLDVVMGEEERGVEVRRTAEMCREKARAAVGEGGSSDRNLRAFVEYIGATSTQSLEH